MEKEIKRLIIASDSHKHSDKLSLINMYEDDNDIKDITYILVGDSEDEEDNIRPFISVRGNMDFYPYPIKLELVIYNHRILIYHGHIRCNNNNCDVVIQGHTHVFKNEMIDKVLYLNPGSVTYPRRDSNSGFLEVDFYPDGKINVNYVTMLEVITYFRSKNNGR